MLGVGDDGLGSAMEQSKGTHFVVARVLVAESGKSGIIGSSKILGKGIESKGIDEDKF